MNEDKNITISRPDKENCLFIQNKSDDVAKMETILVDTANFTRCSGDQFKCILELREKQPIVKLNSYIKVFNFYISYNFNKVLKEVAVSRIHPLIMFGLPKIHKEDTPTRPILSTTQSFSPEIINVSKIVYPFSFVSEIL